MIRATILAVVAVAAYSAPASAQPRDNYPVCLRQYGPITYDECHYTSIPQCQATASGRSAQCLINPFFVAGVAEPHGRRHHRRGYY